MILFDERQKQSLLEFGIEIPVYDSRAINTFNKLKDHNRLGPHIKNWHIDSINETITKDDLLRVHSRRFVKNLFSNELEPLLYGQRHRYCR
mgnify:CR=1 FL=1